MIRKALFLLVVKADEAISGWRPKTVEGYTSGDFWDLWDACLEKANMSLWPSYDGERFRDLF